MSALILASAKALAMICFISALIALVACTAWRVVYYGCRCRRNPIGKALMLTIAALWLISSAIINLM